LGRILTDHAIKAEPAQRRSLFELALEEHSQALRLEPQTPRWLEQRAHTWSQWADFDNEHAVSHLNNALTDLSSAVSLDQTDKYFLKQQARLLRRRADYETGAKQAATLQEAKDREAAT